MLSIKIPASENWNERTQEFEYTNETVLKLEHSLVSVSKWEARWEKPFMSGNKTTEETVDYIRCMTITQNVNPNVYYSLTSKNIDDVIRYIAKPMTATTFTDRGGKSPSREQITAEIVYYQMIALNIPFECQKWHFNRLLTLIRVCNIKNQPAKKRSRADILRSNAALNAERREKFNTTG